MSDAPAAAPAAAPQQVTYYVYQMNAPAGGAPGGGSVKVDWSTCFTFYFLRGFLNVLLWASWAIFIAGVSKEQQNCNDGLMGQGPFPDNYALFNNGVGPSSTQDCVYYFALLWWSLWLQFVTIVAATITTFQVLSKYRHVRAIFTTTMYFFIMSSVLMFFIADKFNIATYLLKNKVVDASSNWTSGSTLVLVGTICSLVFNFIYMIWNSYADVPQLPTGAPVAMPHAHDGDAFVAPVAHKTEATTSV